MSKITSSQYPSVLPSMYPNSSPSSSEIQTPTSPPTESQQASPSSPLGYWGISNISRHPKQIRTPRAPLYVPAVLRPTEKPTKPSSPDTQQALSPRTEAALTERHLHAPSQGNLPSLRRMVTEEWLGGPRGHFAGPPSRNHWKPDPASDSCDSPTCERSFTLLIRRHHCRRCGCIFCAEHSPHFVPLDQHARFHPSAPKYRACDDCFKDYSIWETERLQRLSDNAADSSDLSRSLVNTSININTKSSVSDPNAASLAQSVPSNWNWSTF